MATGLVVDPWRCSTSRPRSFFSSSTEELSSVYDESWKNLLDEKWSVFKTLQVWFQWLYSSLVSKGCCSVPTCWPATFIIAASITIMHALLLHSRSTIFSGSHQICVCGIIYIQYMYKKKYCSSESLWRLVKTHNQALRAKLCTCMLRYSCNWFVFCKRRKKKTTLCGLRCFGFLICVLTCRWLLYNISQDDARTQTSAPDGFLYCKDSPCAHLLL